MNSLPDEDDFTHYFNATQRLSAELAEANRRLSESVAMHDAVRERLTAQRDEARAECAVRDAYVTQVKADRYAVEQAHAESVAYAEALEALLHRLRAWDHFDGAADGTYWRSQIDAVLKSVPRQRDGQ